MTTSEQGRVADETIVRREQTRVLSEVKAELNRQIEKWSVQNNSLLEWLAIEAEEFGEYSADTTKAYFLGRECQDLRSRFFEETDALEKEALWNKYGRTDAHFVKHLDALRTELIQVAAVAVAAIESIDRQRRTGDL